MKAKLIRIGNSQGVRLPKSVIESCGFGTEIDLEVRDGTVVLSPVRGARDGWEAAFARMAAHDDAPVLPELAASDWDEEEWTW